MRRYAAILPLTGLVIGSSLALASPAFADGTAPAPLCMESNYQLYCSPGHGVAPFTWTQTITFDGSSSTSSFQANVIKGACEHNAEYTESYSYVSGGVKYDSAKTQIACTGISPG